MSRVFVPHDYQKPIFDHIQEHPRNAVWAPMGGGKTVSTLTALDHLALVDDVFPALVLAPLRVARSTWPDEIAKWEHLKHLRVSTVCGDAIERKVALRQSAEIYTMNYDNLVWLLEHLDGKWPFKTVVSDESTRLKSFRLRQGGKRTAALARVAHAEGSRFIELTGTPSPNGLIDLWGQVWFLDRGERLGRTYSAFEQRWFRKGYDGYSLEPMPHAQAEIQERLRDICLTVEGLPVDEPIINDIVVQLPPAARKLYLDMEKDMFAEIEEHGVEAFNAAGRTSKLQQICAGALIHDTESGDWSEVHDAKIDALKSVIEEANGAPVLVAYQFRSDVIRLKRAFPQSRILDSEPKTLREWNAGKIPVLIAHPKSAGHGLNMAEGGNILAMFSTGWSLEEYQQIIERIGPLRQKQAGLNRPVFVHRIIAHKTVDEMIYERLASKRSVQSILLGAMKRQRRAA